MESSRTAPDEVNSPENVKNEAFCCKLLMISPQS
jgi:hypothetical protein